MRSSPISAPRPGVQRLTQFRLHPRERQHDVALLQLCPEVLQGYIAVMSTSIGFHVQQQPADRRLGLTTHDRSQRFGSEVVGVREE